MAFFKNEIVVGFFYKYCTEFIKREKYRERENKNRLNGKVTRCTYTKEVMKLTFEYQLRFLERICKICRFNGVTKAFRTSSSITGEFS